MVVNTDVAPGPGEHWLALCALRNIFKIDMFDSFGLPPNIYFFDLALSHSFNRNIQSVSSKVCGHYLFLIIYFRCRNYSFN